VLKDHVIGEVGRKLRKLGFTRKGNSWRREGEPGIEVFDIQGSQWGSGAFYLNVGIYLGDDRELREPQEYECQLRERIAHENRTSEQVFEDVRGWFEAQSRRLDSATRARSERVQPVRVSHATFGEGTVASERDGTVTVKFDDGTTRVLKKSYVQEIGGSE
jgi:hypothetical protein